jgi:PhnB protein
MPSDVKPIPDGYQTLTPYLVVDDADGAINFYTRAFGARELYRMAGPDGKIWHAEVEIGDSKLMLSDEFSEMGHRSAKTMGGTPVSLMMYVEDADAAFKRAVDAGATSIMPPETMFWGDRFAKIADPFGNEWQIATHVEDVSPEEMKRRSEEAMKQTKQP